MASLAMCSISDNSCVCVALTLCKMCSAVCIPRSCREAAVCLQVHPRDYKTGAVTALREIDCNLAIDSSGRPLLLRRGLHITKDTATAAYTKIANREMESFLLEHYAGGYAVTALSEPPTPLPRTSTSYSPTGGRLYLPSPTPPCLRRLTCLRQPQSPHPFFPAPLLQRMHCSLCPWTPSPAARPDRDSITSLWWLPIVLRLLQEAPRREPCPPRRSPVCQLQVHRRRDPRRLVVRHF